jgi:phosphohistidine swiveling domain-containing protein
MRYLLHRLPYRNKDAAVIGNVDPLLVGRASLRLGGQHLHVALGGSVYLNDNAEAATPLFVPAAAVVVNVGAVVSHAVIVSRELGIPCVVSVLDATSRIPDGALVTVDGSAGTVTLIDG